MPEPETPVPATDAITTATPPPAEPLAAPQASAAEPLGEGGIKALENERQARKDLERKLKELEPLAAKAAEYEQSQKTEAERQAEALQAAKAEGATVNTELLQLRAALAKAPAGMDTATIADLASRLRGSTPEELEADALALFARMPAATAGGGVQLQRSPVESLQPGALPTTPELPIAEQIVAAEASGDRGLAMQLKSVQLAELRSKT